MDHRQRSGRGRLLTSRHRDTVQFAGMPFVQIFLDGRQRLPRIC